MATNKTGYVDGFVLIVPKKNLAAYRKMAGQGAKIWMKCGALSYKECQIDDAKPKWITLTFPVLTKAKPSDTIWFSYVEYKSKKHRDQVNARVMKDPSMQSGDMNAMPFDMKRMSFAGFKVVVSG